MQDVIDLLNQLGTAAKAREWYPLIAIVLHLALVAFRKFSPDTWDKLPERLQWAPVILPPAIGGFVDAEVAGRSWYVALGMALYAALTIGGGAVGIHHVSKNASPKNVKPVDATIVSLVLLAALSLTGCGFMRAAEPALADAAVLLSDASNAVEQANSIANLLFAVHPDPAEQKKVEELVIDCRSALAASADTVHQTQAVGDSFARFRSAYAELGKELERIGAAGQPGKVGGLKRQLPVPLACRPRAS